MEEPYASCLKITEDFAARPSGQLFRFPINPELDGLPDYYQYVNDPQDLSTIAGRLRDHRYSSVDKWYKDMCQVWQNAILYNGSASVIAIVARYNAELFEKECRKIGKIQRKEWNNLIKKYYEKINRTMQSAPPLFKPFYANKDFLNVTSPDDLKRIAEDATKTFTTRDDIIQVIQLLNIYNVNVDTKKEELSYDVNKLPESALKAIVTLSNRKHHKKSR